jgi:hypothetical protein
LLKKSQLDEWYNKKQKTEHAILVYFLTKNVLIWVQGKCMKFHYWNFLTANLTLQNYTA